MSHAATAHGANVIQHNAGDYAHSRRVAMTANPTRCARLVFAQSALCLAPPRSAPQSVQRKASLCCWQWCRSVAPQSPPSLAAPVVRSGPVIVGQPVVRGCRPGGLRLKGLYARPASSGCGGSCRAKRPRVTRSRLASHRCPPRSGVVMQRQPPVRQRCHRAPFRRLRTLCRPHPQTPRRGPAMPPEASWRPPVTGCRKRT